MEARIEFEEVAPGATLVNRSYAVEDLAHEVASIPTTAWRDLPYSSEWSQVKLVQDRIARTDVEQLESVRRIVETLTKSPMDVTLTLLRPGGWTKTHRDISGGGVFGVVRFHIPIVTPPGAEMKVSGQTLVPTAGELWILDTTYRHAVYNKGTADRIHLIVDVAKEDLPPELIPVRGLRYRAHAAWFVLVAALTLAGRAIRRPRGTAQAVQRAVRLRVGRKSALSDLEAP